jgi:hypothetical protein
VTHFWSDPGSWPNLSNRIPLEGEAVVIDSKMEIIYDIGISPVFESLEINGKLSFLYG